MKGRDRCLDDKAECPADKRRLVVRACPGDGTTPSSRPIDTRIGPLLLKLSRAELPAPTICKAHASDESRAGPTMRRAMTVRRR
jgi:hypothetical protein